jgi:hypothetical protein
VFSRRLAIDPLFSSTPLRAYHINNIATTTASYSKIVWYNSETPSRKRTTNPFNSTVRHSYNILKFTSRCRLLGQLT